MKRREEKRSIENLRDVYSQWTYLSEEEDIVEDRVRQEKESKSIEWSESLLPIRLSLPLEEYPMG